MLELPQNLDAEAALLGAGMIDPAVVADSADLAGADFASAYHGDVWEALRRLGDAGDWVTLANEIRRTAPGRYDSTLEARLQELAHALPSAAGAETYAKIVKECAERRRIITACRDAAAVASSGTASSAVILARLLADSTPRVERGAKPLGAYIDDAQTRSNSGGITGLPTGVPGLDEITGGLCPKRLIVVGARPGQGKSSLIAQAAVSAMDAGAAVLMFSLEMSGEEIAARMICGRAELDYAEYTRGRLDPAQRERAATAAQSLKSGAFMLDQSVALDITDIRLRALRYTARHGDLGLIVVDYLGLAKAAASRGESRYLEVGAVSAGLKNLAKELNVPVLAAHQVNRGAEERGDAPPKLANLRESGNIEQDADQVVFIWPFVKDPRTNETVDWKLQKRPVQLIVAKNRHGRQDVVYCNFNKPCTRFESETVTQDTKVFDPHKAFMAQPQSRGPGYE